MGCGSDAAVAPIPGNPDPILSDLSTMNVGDVRVLTFSSASGGLNIPASMQSAQYAVILGNMNLNSGTIATSTVHGDWLAPESRSASADILSPGFQTLTAPTSPSRGEVFEASLRAFERSGLPLPGGRGATPGSAVAADRQAPLPSAATNPPPAVGSTIGFKVLTSAGFGGVTTSACSASGFTQTTGVVKYVSQHAIIVSDVASAAGGFTNADFQAIGDEFDQMIYPTEVSYFGTPTDIDNNGHIFIYYTPAVNKLTPAGQANTTGYVGGFFFAGDLYAPTSQGCLSSNQGEIFYLLAPDPGGANGNTFSTSFVRQVTRGTVAHEFQHMINSGNRYVSPTVQPFETTWLDEALAHLAEDAVGRTEAGFADSYTITYNDITALDPTITQAFFLQNFARTKYYVERPDTTAAIVSHAKAAANLASRGAEWSMLRYAADWFNTGGNPRTLTRALAAGPDTGIVNLAKSAGVPMDTILARYLVTLYTDHRPYMPASSPYNYKSYTLRQLVTGTLVGSENSTGYLPVGAIGNGTTTLTARVPASSAAYFLTSLTNGGARSVKITDSNGNVATDANGRVYVVRTQ